MKDLRSILLTALIPKLATLTGRTVYTIVPIDAVYPYVYVSDIYQKEVGSKIKYHYELDVLVHVVHKDESSNVALYNDIDDVCGMIDNGPGGLTLTSPYKVLQTTLNSSSTTEILTDTGKEQIGIIRINFLIT